MRGKNRRLFTGAWLLSHKYFNRLALFANLAFSESCASTARRHAFALAI
jgi:hypothetical protein